MNIKLACGTRSIDTGDVCLFPSHSSASLSAHLHGTSTTAIGSTIRGVADKWHTEWVQGPLTVTGSAKIHCCSKPTFDAVRNHSRFV